MKLLGQLRPPLSHESESAPHCRGLVTLVVADAAEGGSDSIDGKGLRLARFVGRLGDPRRVAADIRCASSSPTPQLGSRWGSGNLLAAVVPAPTGQHRDVGFRRVAYSPQ